MRCTREKARTHEEIKNSMYLQLTGKEVGLLGYWRLDGIVEDKQRKVIDFSVNGNDGIVKSDAYVSSVILDRNLAETPAIKYENEELFAVSERATYTEEFEFKTSTGTNWVSSSDKIFSIDCKGKKSRRSEEWIPITEETTQFTSLGNNWYKASTSFTVPDGVSMVRSFGISGVKGNWTKLEIRNPKIKLVSDSITQKECTEGANINTLVDNQIQLQESLKKLGIKEVEEGVLLKKNEI